MGCGVLVYTAFPPFSQYPHPFPPAHRRPWRAGPSPDSPSPPHLWAGAAAAAAATAAAAPPPPSLRATMGGIGSLLAAARQRLPCRRATPTAAKIGAPAGAAPAATTPKPGAGAGNKAVMGALRSSTPQAEAKAAKAAAAAVTKTRTDAGAEPAAPATPASTPRSAARRAKRAGAGASQRRPSRRLPSPSRPRQLRQYVPRHHRPSGPGQLPVRPRRLLQTLLRGPPLLCFGGGATAVGKEGQAVGGGRHPRCAGRCSYPCCSRGGGNAVAGV